MQKDLWGELSHDEVVLIIYELLLEQRDGRGTRAEMFLNPNGGWDSEMVNTQQIGMDHIIERFRSLPGERKRRIVARMRQLVDMREHMDEMSDQLSPLHEEIEALNDALSEVTSMFKRLEQIPLIPLCPAHMIESIDLYKPIVNKTFTLCEPDILAKVYKPMFRTTRPIGNEDWDYTPAYEVYYPDQSTYVAIDVKGLFRPGHDISQVHKFFEFCPKPLRVMNVFQPSSWEHRRYFEAAGAETFLFIASDPRYRLDE